MASILIAEDMEDMRRLLVRVLAQAHQVIAASDGAEALDLLRHHRPEMVILDVAMPKLSGLQVCKLLRADSELHATKVIILSANATAEDAQAAGADHFIAKPFLPSNLLAAVNDLLQRHAFPTAEGSGVRERVRPRS